MGPKIKPSTVDEWCEFYKDVCRAQCEEIAVLRDALETAINSVECSSICPNTKRELPWYRKAKKVLGKKKFCKFVLQF